MSLRILHFADAHVDIANYGRHDPESGLPVRVLDFLKSLDTIVDTAIQERVDLVLFAGDAYKDRTPAPTFQREWGRRIVRLSEAGIPTLLLVGNHDLSPALGRAHALEEFSTLRVPHVRVLDRPVLLGPDDLDGLPLYVIALPWISRSGMVAHLGLSLADPGKVYEELEARLQGLVAGWLEQVDPALPVVLTAHASVQGAIYGGERSVLLGGDLVLSGALTRNPRLDYVALGHIHKPQDVNQGQYPPAIYPGSIERVDFGEVNEDRFFVIAHVERNGTQVEWRKLEGVRPFLDCSLRLKLEDGDFALEQRILNALPSPARLEGAVVRLTLEYPREWEPLINETALRAYAAGALEFRLNKRPQLENRIRLPDNVSLGSLTPLELLELYWDASKLDSAERPAISQLAAEILRQEDHFDDGKQGANS